jgi:SOS-response transcriptional repressors (RecA-mediated autopeptidases)
MFPEYLVDDIVIIRKQPCCESGDDCAVMVNDTDATLKKVNLYEDGIELEAINPMYGKKKFSKEEIQNLPGDAMDLLGHADIKLTQNIYTHIRKIRKKIPLPN